MNKRIEFIGNAMKYLVIISFLLTMSGNIFANTLTYLEERTAYCHSQGSLGKYLKSAQNRNIDNMNKLVLQGECDFVPEGQIFSLSEYHNDIIGSVPVISFVKGDKEMWTFQTFVQTTEFKNL